jgi:ATP synthase protein I
MSLIDDSNKQSLSKKSLEEERLSDLAVRLECFEQQQSQEKNKHNPDVIKPKNVTASASVALDLIAGLLAGAALGYALDQFLGSKPIALIVSMVLGVCGGFYNMYKRCSRDIENSEPSKD